MMAIRGNHTNEQPLAIRLLGIGHSRTLPHGNMATQVPCYRDRLLHQIGQGRTIAHYHGEKCLKLCLEKYHFLLWNPEGLRL